MHMDVTARNRTQPQKKSYIADTSPTGMAVPVASSRFPDALSFSPTGNPNGPAHPQRHGAPPIPTVVSGRLLPASGDRVLSSIPPGILGPPVLGAFMRAAAGTAGHPFTRRPAVDYSSSAAPTSHGVSLPPEAVPIARYFPGGGRAGCHDSLKSSLVYNVDRSGNPEVSLKPGIVDDGIRRMGEIHFSSRGFLVTILRPSGLL